jgi:hypothetical protein
MAIIGSGRNTKSKHHEYGNQFQTLICSFKIPRCLAQENGVEVTSELPQNSNWNYTAYRISFVGWYITQLLFINLMGREYKKSCNVYRLLACTSHYWSKSVWPFRTWVPSISPALEFNNVCVILEQPHCIGPYFKPFTANLPSISI